jgi:hypothetical protein
MLPIARVHWQFDFLNRTGLLNLYERAAVDSAGVSEAENLNNTGYQGRPVAQDCS